MGAGPVPSRPLSPQAAEGEGKARGKPPTHSGPKSSRACSLNLGRAELGQEPPFHPQESGGTLCICRKKNSASLGVCVALWSLGGRLRMVKMADTGLFPLQPPELPFLWGSERPRRPWHWVKSSLGNPPSSLKMCAPTRSAGAAHTQAAPPGPPP